MGILEIYIIPRCNAAGRPSTNPPHLLERHTTLGWVGGESCSPFRKMGGVEGGDAERHYIIYIICLGR